jgi:RHS repeat-associated protein
LLSYAYDAVGNRTSVSDNFGVSVTSSYDARDLLTARTWEGLGPDSARIEFDYDALGRATQVRRFADDSGLQLVARSTFAFDARWRETDRTHWDALDNILADYDYAYDLADRLISESHHGQTSSYDYDVIDQLLGATHSGQADESYQFDSNGNRIGSGYVVGPNNQILADGTFDYTYDAEGNLATKTELATGYVTTYTYDHRNRLILLREQSPGGILLKEFTFVYDVFDRRIAQFVDPDGAGLLPAQTSRYVYDGEHVWADFDGGGVIVARYLHGDQLDEILARYRPGQGTAWYLTDHLGTVRDIVDATGAVIQHIDYDSFGNIVFQSAPLFGDRYAFTGREWDAAAGLYYYRARYYDPALGRFISQDPIQFAAGDSNLYRYVSNSPLNATDPLGLAEVTEYALILALIVYPIASAPQKCFIKTLTGEMLIGKAVDTTLAAFFGLPAAGGVPYLEIVAATLVCSPYWPVIFSVAGFSLLYVLSKAHLDKIPFTAIAKHVGRSFFFTWGRRVGDDVGGHVCGTDAIDYSMKAVRRRWWNG